MNRKMLNLLNGNTSSIDSIRSRSTKAVCGVFEREIVVKDSEVSSVKAKLKRAGFIIVGTGSAGFKRTKIWYNPAGVNL